MTSLSSFGPFSVPVTSTKNMVPKNVNKMNVKLGRRKKALLRLLYEHRGYAFPERDLVMYVYGSMAPSSRASASRALWTLVKDGLVETRKDVATRLFRISPKGIEYVEERLNSPQGERDLMVRRV